MRVRAYVRACMSACVCVLVGQQHVAVYKNSSSKTRAGVWGCARWHIIFHHSQFNEPALETAAGCADTTKSIVGPPTPNTGPTQHNYYSNTARASRECNAGRPLLPPPPPPNTHTQTNPFVCISGRRHYLGIRNSCFFFFFFFAYRTCACFSFRPFSPPPPPPLKADSICP